MTAAQPTVDRPRAHAPDWPRRLRGALVGWLPVLLMALLALGTWWLVENTPKPVPERPAAAPTHEPDYVMERFLVQRFAPDGRLAVQIEGDRLRHYPDTDTLEIDAPRITMHAADGRVTESRADRALANGDASEVQLIGDAQVNRGALAGEPPIEFRGEFLHAYARTERLRSHRPVVVRRGATEVRAGGMEYDHLARTLVFTGKQTATFAARGAAR